jgi:rod shape-determining protein MreC
VNRSYRGSRLIVGALVVGSLVLLTLDLRSDSSFDGVRRLVASVVSPLQSGVRGVAEPIADFIGRVGTMWSSEARIRELEAENEALRISLSQSEDAAGRSKQFDALMKTAGIAGYKVVAAQVIATESASGLARVISIDVGTADGVREDMTVMTGDGLVGRVTRSMRASSTVLLLTDPTFRIGVRLAGSDILGVASGRGSGTLDLQLLDPQATLRVGDLLLARGSYASRPFVPGLPVGRVTSVVDSPGTLTRTAILAPLVATGRLDIVGVVVAAPARDPRDALVPAPPVPTPLPTVTVYSTEPAPTATPTTATPTTATPTTATPTTTSTR